MSNVKTPSHYPTRGVDWEQSEDESLLQGSLSDALRCEPFSSFNSQTRASSADGRFHRCRSEVALMLDDASSIVADPPDVPADVPSTCAR